MDKKTLDTLFWVVIHWAHEGRFFSTYMVVDGAGDDFEEIEKNIKENLSLPGYHILEVIAAILDRKNIPSVIEREMKVLYEAYNIIQIEEGGRVDEDCLGWDMDMGVLTRE